MNKLLIAGAAAASLGITSLGLAGTAGAQTYYRSGPGPTVQYMEPAPGQPMVMEGRNTTMMSSDEAQRYIPESYSTGGYIGSNPYVRNPGVEPYIAKQIEQDQRGD